CSNTRQCLVCATITTSGHLGMDICRSCSVFFKRAKISGRRYPCRRGDRQCHNFNDGKLTCRGCRFAKCVAIGMQYDGPLRARRKPASILQRTMAESKAFIKIRREQELKVILRHGGHARYSHTKQELYYAHWDTSQEIYRIFITEGYTFFKKAFPAFAELHVREQESIFKDYIAKMSMIEGYYRTSQIFGEVKKYVMCSVLTFQDRDLPIEWEYEDMEQNENASFLISSARTQIEEQDAVFLPMFNKCMLTEREFQVLVVLAMSEQDIPCGISEQAQEMIDRYRHEALEDLQLYYRDELGLRDFSTRLGNLMSLNHVLQECKSRFKIFFRFYATLFDVFITDKFIKDFLL
ncbi:hypothetical protein PENTCL1PPCAC_30392, partial [Pristionchus entomophagus]